MTQGLAVLRGGHIGGHIVLENVRYFTVKCDLKKLILCMKKARNPCKIKGTEKVYAMHKYCIKRRFFSYFVI